VVRIAARSHEPSPADNALSLTPLLGERGCAWNDGRSVRATALVVLLLGLALAPTHAGAHAGPPTFEQIVVDPNDATHLFSGSNFGTLFSTDGGAHWGWVCREAMRASLDVTDPIVAHSDASTIFVGDGAGLWRGTSDACDWTLAAAVFNRPVPALARGGAHVLFAGTAANEDDNALHRSTDDGVTWQPVIGPTFRDYYESVLVAPSNALRVYAVSTLPPERVEPWMPTVWRSDDGGDHWTSTPFTQLLAAEWHLFLVAVDPTNADRVLARTQDLHMGGHDRLLLSEDAGASWTVVGMLQQVLRGVWSDDGAHVWVGGPLDGVWRSDDHGHTFAAARAGLDVRGTSVREGALWVTGTQAYDGFAIARSTDLGVTLPTFATLSSITGILACPPTSSVGMACPAHRMVIDNVLASTDAAMPDAGPLDASPNDGGALDAAPSLDGGGGGARPAGCGCAAGRREPSHAAWIALAIVLAYRRAGRPSRNPRRNAG
jgi:hypothetical protein